MIAHHVITFIGECPEAAHCNYWHKTLGLLSDLPHLTAEIVVDTVESVILFAAAWFFAKSNLKARFARDHAAFDAEHGIVHEGETEPVAAGPLALPTRSHMAKQATVINSVTLPTWTDGPSVTLFLTTIIGYVVSILTFAHITVPSGLAPAASAWAGVIGVVISTIVGLVNVFRVTILHKAAISTPTTATVTSK